MRTFVAINLPHVERTRLHEALEPLRARDLPVRWLPPESFHITLKFLGDTESGAVSEVANVLAAAAVRRTPLDLTLGGVGAFPTLRRANIVWVGASQEPELMALQKQLEPALSRLGFPREHRPYRPHITVGRARSDARALDIERYVGLVDYEAVVRVESVELMQSHQSSRGSTYETLLTRRLGEKD